MCAGEHKPTASTAAQFFDYELDGKVVEARPEWLLCPECSVPDHLAGVKAKLITALQRSNSDATSEASLQQAVMTPLAEFVRNASRGTIKLHDTHDRDYLRGLKPDATGTASATVDARDVEAPQAALIIEMKKPKKRLTHSSVKGQIGQYAMEVAAAQAVDGPMTVAVMNASHILFLRVSDHRATVVWVSEPFSWTTDTGLDSGVVRLYAYVLECTARLEQQRSFDAAWFKDYIPMRYLGSGVSARALAARPRGEAPAGATGEVVVKLFDVPDCAGAPRRLDSAVSPTVERSRDRKSKSKVVLEAVAFSLPAAGAAVGAGGGAGGGVTASGPPQTRLGEFAPSWLILAMQVAVQRGLIVFVTRCHVVLCCC